MRTARTLALGAILSAAACTAEEPTCTLEPDQVHEANGKKEVQRMFSSSEVLDYCQNNTETAVVTCLTEEESDDDQYIFKTHEFTCDSEIEKSMKAIESKLQECVSGSAHQNCDV